MQQPLYLSSDLTPCICPFPSGFLRTTSRRGAAPAPGWETGLLGPIQFQLPTGRCWIRQHCASFHCTFLWKWKKDCLPAPPASRRVLKEQKEIREEHWTALAPAVPTARGWSSSWGIRKRNHLRSSLPCHLTMVPTWWGRSEAALLLWPLKTQLAVPGLSKPPGGCLAHRWKRPLSGGTGRGRGVGAVSSASWQ